jgi:hypothetical protein
VYNTESQISVTYVGIKNFITLAPGGYTAGIEVWNPADGSVKTLNSTFPLNDDRMRAQMIAVNGNTELIFYESCISPGMPKGIWKFSQVNNTWAKIGEMLYKRMSFSALAVEDITCP